MRPRLCKRSATLESCAAARTDSRFRTSDAPDEAADAKMAAPQRTCVPFCQRPPGAGDSHRHPPDGRWDVTNERSRRRRQVDGLPVLPRCTAPIPRQREAASTSERACNSPNRPATTSPWVTLLAVTRRPATVITMASRTRQVRPCSTRADGVHRQSTARGGADSGLTCACAPGSSAAVVYSACGRPKQRGATAWSTPAAGAAGRGTAICGGSRKGVRSCSRR